MAPHTKRGRPYSASEPCSRAGLMKQDKVGRIAAATGKKKSKTDSAVAEECWGWNLAAMAREKVAANKSTAGESVD